MKQYRVMGRDKQFKLTDSFSLFFILGQRL